MNFGNYSETEQDTGFTWVNGYSIYKKTIHFGSLPSGGTRSVNHNISNMAQLIEISGIASNSSDERYPIPKYMLNTNYGTQIKVTSTVIQMDTNSGIDMSSFDAWITLLYTKNS